MRAKEFIVEGLNHPIIVVDVQPAYAVYAGYESEDICKKIIHFVNKQTGPVLMFVNADETGMSEDNVEYDIIPYWEEVAGGPGQYEKYEEDPYYTGPINWSRFTIVNKGYGYLRSWMDQDVSPKSIIKVIRLMYQNKISNSSELFGGAESDDYEINMRALIGYDYVPWMKNDPISVMWTSVAQLKKFTRAYLVGGGRNECLREVELLMSAFNIKYKRIDSLVYG